MDLDAIQKVVQIILGIFTICGTLYAGWRLFHKRVGTFVRSRKVKRCQEPLNRS